jgi:hypothetical protein
MKLIHVNGNSLIASHTIWSICSLQDCNKSVTFLGSVNIGAITSTMKILAPLPDPFFIEATANVSGLGPCENFSLLCF